MKAPTDKELAKPGLNPMNSSQACIHKLVNTSVFFKSFVVTSVVKINPLIHVFTFQYKVF